MSAANVLSTNDTAWTTATKLPISFVPNATYKITPAHFTLCDFQVLATGPANSASHNFWFKFWAARALLLFPAHFLKILQLVSSISGKLLKIFLSMGSFITLHRNEIWDCEINIIILFTLHSNDLRDVTFCTCLSEEMITTYKCDVFLKKKSVILLFCMDN